MTSVARRYQRQFGRSRTGAAPVARANEALRAPVVLMVSGGADSTALLVRACTGTLNLDDGRGEARVARERLHVLHVNHHLRGAESDADEAFVRGLCDAYGVPLRVEHFDPDEPRAERNLEAAAREKRYFFARRYLKQLCEQFKVPRRHGRIATAHTASDRTETFLMNAIKGAGPAGLSSIPRRRGNIVRPLLDATHAELCRYLLVRGQAWREDESNADTSYLRNFVRNRIVPLAAERNAHVERTVSASCDILGDEDAFMSKLAATALRALTRRDSAGVLVLDAARMATTDVALARRMVRLAVEHVSPRRDLRLDLRHVEAVLACVAAGEGSVTLPGDLDARVEFGALTLRTAPAREEAVATWLSLPGRIALSGGATLTGSLLRLAPGVDPVAYVRSETREWGQDRAFADAAALGFAEADLERLAAGGTALPAEALTARLWVDGPQPGDVVCPLGMQGRSKKLSDLLGAERVPVAERPQVPVVRTAPGGAIVWVAGIRSDDRFKCTPTTRILVKLELRRVSALDNGR